MRNAIMNMFAIFSMMALLAGCVGSSDKGSDKESASVNESENRVEAKAAMTTDMEESASGDPVFTVVEVMPEYPGGDAELLKFISSNVKYPASSKEKGEQGCVICSFVVNKDGSISGCKIVRGISAELDAEAIRVLNMMPRWTPGKQGGKSVAVKYTVPVTFRLR